MSDRDRLAQTEGEHGRAVQLLEEAVSQERRLRDEREEDTDASNELAVGAALRVAEDEVSARERWLNWVDDHEY